MIAGLPEAEAAQRLNQIAEEEAEGSGSGSWVTGDFHMHHNAEASDVNLLKKTNDTRRIVG